MSYFETLGLLTDKALINYRIRLCVWPFSIIKATPITCIIGFYLFNMEQQTCIKICFFRQEVLWTSITLIRRLDLVALLRDPLTSISVYGHACDDLKCAEVWVGGVEQERRFFGMTLIEQQTRMAGYVCYLKTSVFFRELSAVSNCARGVYATSFKRLVQHHSYQMSCVF